MNPELPLVAPELAAAAVESLTSRLRKKLDAAIETYVAAPVTVEGAVRRVRCGEDAEVVLTPGPSGAVMDAGQAVCSCLLAPRCLHRAAVLGACPVADADTMVHTETAADVNPMAQTVGTSAEAARPAQDTTGANTAQDVVAVPVLGPDTVAASPQTGPTDAQLAAARALWAAAAAVLAAGVPAAGAVAQAEVLRASHTARLAGLHRAEAAALRVVRGLRGARSRHDGHRLADLVADLRELLLTTGLLAAGEPPRRWSGPPAAATGRKALCAFTGCAGSQ